MAVVVRSEYSTDGGTVRVATRRSRRSIAGYDKSIDDCMG